MEELDEDIDIEPINLKVEETKNEFSILEYLDKSQLEEIRMIFKNSAKGGFKKTEFKSKVLAKFKIEISDEDYETLTTKLDCNKNDFVTWDEMVTYLVLELECKRRDDSKSMGCEALIEGEPEVINSGHRNAIIHIMFFPSVRRDGAIDYEDGKYLSMSRDGYLNAWSLDLRFLRTYRDKPLHFTKRGTWVTNFVCLPDLSLFVTSSNERELRFYDTRSKRFNLIMVIVNMPFCVNHMSYYFLEDLKEESILVCGDVGGNIRVMQFPKEDKGPFKQKIGVETVVLKWDQIIKGKLPLMKAYNILNVHADWVKQVYYYKLLGCIVSCSTCPNAMFVGDFHVSETKYNFFVKRGIETFCVNEDSPLIITGSIDCVLRLWDPFITKKPISVLWGHHASIVKIFLQDHGRKIFSFDKNRILKVWDNLSQTCIQTYSGFALKNGPFGEFSTYYNDRNHLFIVADLKIASKICGKVIDEQRSDGTTHGNPVSFVFYNRLYRCVITCGMDSTIGIWDPWTNKRKSCIQKAHFSAPLGVHAPLPITAATLDPPHQYLLTGSSNGDIKMWDFNIGICIRNMNIGPGYEVTKLIWQKTRILALGEHCQVIEFGDSVGGKASVGKPWEVKHSSEIISADFRPGQALAAGTCNGDLIFWRLETGQLYKWYNVTHPTGLLLRMKAEKKADTKGGLKKISTKNLHRGKRDRSTNSPLSKDKAKESSASEKLNVPRKILTAEKLNPSVERNLAIYCMLFLKKREMLPDQATLMVATENGMIQAWSHHPGGGFIMAFRAVHIERDYVASMNSDPNNEFLFTGTVCGYIKIWLMKNFCLTTNSEVNVCMPLYRLQFPFLINDRIRTRVKAALKNQPSPLLLSSYKGHAGAISSLEYIEECKILFTSSTDKTVRIWTLSGRYIGCLGQNKPWLNLNWRLDPEETNAATDFRIPPELDRNASYTTLKVLRGAPPIITKKHDAEVDLSISEEERKFGVYGQRLTAPYLGRNHSFPPKLSKKKALPPVDESMAKIPVFTHLILSPWQQIPKFSMPQCIQDVKARQISSPDTRNSVYQDENSVKHFLTVHQGLREYLLSVKVISSIFSYLNKFYVAFCLNTDLCIQLSSLFSQIVISERISTLMDVIEESLKTPFSIPPEILHNFFNELHEISNGEYSAKYLHLFSRYCPNVLPPMKESDLENHIVEVLELKKKQKQSQNLTDERHGVKRPAEEPIQRKTSYCHRQPRTYSVLFQ